MKSVQTMELFITYFFQFISSKWLNYIIYLATYKFGESFSEEAWILAFMSVSFSA
jgi:hypothetical protein